MSKQQETMLTTHMEGFQDFEVDFGKYEISFRRWIVSQLDGNHVSVQEIRDRFHLSRSHYWDILKRWQERYSEPLHVSLSFMSSKERAENKQLEKRIKELEKQLEMAKMKTIALETLIDVAETEFKIPIRKKRGSKQ
jgi:transposase